jgi:hypothetical protein
MLPRSVSNRAEFIKADLYRADFSKATVLTLFLLLKSTSDSAADSQHEAWYSRVEQLIWQTGRLTRHSWNRKYAILHHSPLDRTGEVDGA